MDEKQLELKLEKLAEILHDIPERKIDWNDSPEMIRVKRKLYFCDLAAAAILNCS